MRLFVKKSFRTSVISRPNYVKPIEHSHGQSLFLHLSLPKLKVKTVAYLQNRMIN